MRGWLPRFLALALLLFSISAWAIEEGEPIQASGDREVWNRATNKVELFGNAIVRQMGESLQADYIILDQNTRILDAHGNCIYITPETVIYGQEMHFSLDTRTGTVIGGRVSTDRFTLAGERINKLGAGRFQTHWGEYSTCRDCPQSWSFQARDVDMQIEGYAYLSDVRIKVKDTSALWLPYLILPMKSKRQSGFLFPRYQLSSSDGKVYVQPYFWAINRSSDMTFGLGTYTERGLRGEWEGRYALSARSGGKANLFYIHDKTLKGSKDDGQYNPSHNPNRWGLEATQTQELPWHLEEKLKLLEVSDNLYPFRFNDLTQKQEAYLGSSINLGYASPYLNANISAKRWRNLLYLGNDFRIFDPATVQEYPSAVVTTRDQYLIGSTVIGGITIGANNFSRAAGGYDDAYQLQKIQNPNFVDGYCPSTGKTLAPGTYCPGVDPLRKATRLSLIPALYSTIQPIDGVSLVPSVQYNSYYYFFRDVAGVPPLYRAYPLLQLDLSTQLEKIYDTGNPDVPRRKHLIRPYLTYSNIPYVQESSNHPFPAQIQYAQNQFNFQGFNFDDNDIVPRDNGPNSANYYTPLGNSLSYGFTTQLIERVGEMEKPEASYRIPVEFSLGQTFNFREYQIHTAGTAPGPQPFSRLYSNLKTNYLSKFTSDTTYYYYPYAYGIRSQVTTTLGYVIERGFHQRILSFDRSVNLGYSWNQVGYTGNATTGSNTDQASITINYSVSDYLLPQVYGTYNFVTHNLFTWGYGLQFQSPSQCWKIATSFLFDPTLGHVFNMPSISLNLVGSGFEGVNEIATAGSATTPGTP